MREPSQPEDAVRLLRLVQDLSMARDQDGGIQLVEHATRALAGPVDEGNGRQGGART